MAFYVLRFVSQVLLVARSSHLSGCFWLFAPKFWEVVGTYELLFCSKRNAALVVLTMLGGGDTQTLLDGKKKCFELYALADSGDTETFQFSLAA